MTMRMFFPLAVFVFLLAAPTRASDPAIPGVVSQGLESYVTSGHQNAMEIWLKGSAMENDINARIKFIDTLAKVESLYGKVTGWELFRVLPMTPSTCRVYAVLKFEKGPLWCMFECYKPKDPWVLSSFDFNTKANVILPPNLLEK